MSWQEAQPKWKALWHFPYVPLLLSRKCGHTQCGSLESPGCLWLREHSITSVPAPSRLVLGERESHLWPWTGPQGLPARQSSSLLPGSLRLPASASLVIVNPALRRHNRKNKSASELLPFQEEALTISLKWEMDSHLHWRKRNKIDLKYINSLFFLLIFCPFLYYFFPSSLFPLFFSFSCYFLFSPFLVKIKIPNLCKSFIFL